MYTMIVEVNIEISSGIGSYILKKRTEVFIRRSSSSFCPEPSVILCFREDHDKDNFLWGSLLLSFHEEIARDGVDMVEVCGPIFLSEF